jgi:hypothetical protein
VKAPRAVAHPLSIAALATLLINDHLFKTRLDWLPRWLVEKLSDAAFVALAPIVALSLYEALSRGERCRRAVTLGATLLVGAVFSLAKCTHAGALVAGWALGALQAPLRGALLRAPIVVDPTDLIALPTLAVALWVERRTRAPSAAAPSP